MRIHLLASLLDVFQLQEWLKGVYGTFIHICLPKCDCIVCLPWQSVGQLKLVVFYELAKAGNMALSSAAGGEKHLQ